uniref:Uncharacterized protein n=1 Tax=Arundo donax TaxID=35708 RepID=A0A0A9CLG5_ARUDO
MEIGAGRAGRLSALETGGGGARFGGAAHTQRHRCVRAFCAFLISTAFLVFFLLFFLLFFNCSIGGTACSWARGEQGSWAAADGRMIGTLVPWGARQVYSHSNWLDNIICHGKKEHATSRCNTKKMA